MVFEVELTRFKDYLRMAMALGGFSRTSLASKIGVSKQAVSTWHRGVVTPTSNETMKALADALGRPVDEVLDVIANHKAAECHGGPIPTPEYRMK